MDNSRYNSRLISFEKAIIKLRMRHKNVIKACLECRKSHTKCANERWVHKYSNLTSRPCYKCVSKGVECIDTPKKERVYKPEHETKSLSSDEGGMSPDDSPCMSPLTGSGPETTVVEPFTVSSYEDLCKVLESIK